MPTLHWSVTIALRMAEYIWDRMLFSSEFYQKKSCRQR